jgi:hypothetical protein
MGMDPGTAMMASGGAGGVGSILSGLQQKKAYKQQAEQAKMAAEANVVDRTRALNEAMAVQNAMMGSSGRTMDSITSILEGDKKRFTSDVSLIRAGAASQAAQLSAAGKTAVAMGIIGGGSQIGMAGANYSMLGGPSGGGMTVQQSQASQQSVSAAHRTAPSKW